MDSITSRMFSLFSSRSQSSLTGDDTSIVDVPPVSGTNIELAADRPGRALKHLIRLSHASHAVLFNHYTFHNHLPHLLCSAYALGADSQRLGQLYESEAQQLVPWEESPEELTREDWSEHLGDRRYQRAYVDFFEDEVVRHKYDWEAVVKNYLFAGPEPMVNNLLGSLTHPAIHLAYGIEFQNKEIAMDALTMAATTHDGLHKYIDNPDYLSPGPGNEPPYSTPSILDILYRIRTDTRFDGLFNVPTIHNLDTILKDRRLEAAALEHVRAWDIGPHSSTADLTAAFHQTQHAATLVLFGGSYPVQRSLDPSKRCYDFFLLHLLTSSHAMRIIFPFIPASGGSVRHSHLNLLRQWHLMLVLVYISQLRPRIPEPEEVSIDHRPEGIAVAVTGVGLGHMDWDTLSAATIASVHAEEAHFPKVVRALREAAETWGDDDKFYFKAARRFVGTFEGYGGF